MTVRTRFAPSPTGPLHIGGARTALFNFLFAKQQGGAFILRIEDTDVERSKPEFETDIIEGLRWLSIQWDEGTDVGGQFGPYRQSERGKHYAETLNRLVTSRAVYPCYCTEEELKTETEVRAGKHLPPRYSGRCRDANEVQCQQWEKEGRKPAYRFRTLTRDISFDDAIRGTVTVRAELLDDFIVARPGGDILYNLAAVIDDADMRITHVIRGEEHLSNTPKQILLYEALGLPIPQFAHLPLLLGTNRAKLSKRDAKTSVLDYRANGYLPEVMVNYLALLGWNPKTEQETFSLDELIRLFRLEHVQKAGAIVDEKKLDHFNGQTIRSLSAEDIVKRAGERLALRNLDMVRLVKAVRLVQDRLTTLNDLAPSLAFLTSWQPPVAALLVPKQGSHERTREALAAIGEYCATLEDSVVEDEKKLEATVRDFLESRGFTTSEALWPLRVALTAKEHSPGVFAVAASLGKEEVARRIQESLKVF